MSDPKEDAAVSPEETPEVKPRETVLVQHLQRDAGSRHLRAQRGGHRRQGVLLDDGTRIRQKAYRKTEISIQTLADNHQSILEHHRKGRLAIFTPDEKEMSYDDVVALLTGKGIKVNEESLKEQLLTVNAPVAPPELDENGDLKLPKELTEEVATEDTTKPNIELSETIAAVDMAEQRKKLPETHAKKPIHLQKKGKKE